MPQPDSQLPDGFAQLLRSMEAAIARRQESGDRVVLLLLRLIYAATRHLCASLAALAGQTTPRAPATPAPKPRAIRAQGIIASTSAATPRKRQSPRVRSIPPQPRTEPHPAPANGQIAIPARQTPPSARPNGAAPAPRPRKPLRACKLSHGHFVTFSN